MFESSGLRPAVGRLLTERDEQTPGAHPYAVLSYDYWSHLCLLKTPSGDSHSDVQGDNWSALVGAPKLDYP